MKAGVRGLTLLELMASLAVLAILVGLAVPGFATLRDRTRASTVSHALTASFMAARMAAVSRRHPVAVCPSADGMRCGGTTDWTRGWIVFDDRLRTGQPTSERDVLHRTDDLGSGMRLTTSMGRDLVRYQPSGRASGTNASFRLCSAPESRLLVSIIVSNAGRARVERPERTTYCGATGRPS